jgi:predicted MFS family arabinose efflux permease
VSGVVGAVLWALTANALCILPSFLVGSLAVQIRREFAFSDTLAGIAFSGFWLVASLCAVPGARLVSRIGVTRSLRLATLATAGFATAIALFAHTEAVFVVLLVLSGSATALATPAMNVRVMAVVSARRQAFAITAAGASPVLSLMAAGFAVGLIGPLVPWQWFFVGCAVALLLMNLGIRPGAPGRSRANRAADPRPRGRGRLIAVMVLVGAGNLAVGGATSFLVLAAPTAGVAAPIAALTVGVVSAVSILVRLAIAAAVDRDARDPLPLVTGMIIVGAVGFVLVGLAEPWAFYTGALLILIPGWSWVSILLFGVLARFRDDLAGASGVVQMVFFIGGVGGPLGMGVALTLLPYSFAWWALGVLMVIAAAGAWAGSRVLPRFDPR